LRLRLQTWNTYRYIFSSFGRCSITIDEQTFFSKAKHFGRQDFYIFHEVPGQEKMRFFGQYEIKRYHEAKTEDTI
jgi:hypothetical protein